MVKRTLCLVAYDISLNRARARALRAVRAFGLDGQKSVHECALTRAERTELHTRLSAVIDPETDKVMILPLDPRGSIRTLGDVREAIVPSFMMIG